MSILIRLASLCGLVAGEDDEQDVGQLHLQHPLHCGASLRPQHQVNEHGDKNVWLSILCRFKVFAANDITSILIVLPLVFYFNRRNKAFWTGIGQVTIAIAGLLPLLAFLAIPKVEQEQVQEEKEEEVELCLEKNPREVLEGSSSNAAVLGVTQIAALGLFFLCKLMMGVAGSTYWTLGVAYMVDAISPVAVPAALGLCYIAGYLGGFFGSLLASACLSQDMWWLGWPIMSLCQATVAFLLFRSFWHNFNWILLNPNILDVVFLLGRPI